MKMKLFEKKKYILKFLLRIDGVLKVVKIIKTNTISTTVKLMKGNEFVITIAIPAYSQKTQTMYYFDYISGNQLTFNQIPRQLNPKEQDMITGQKMIGNIIHGVSQNMKDRIVWILLGVIIGALTAIVICMAIYNNKIQDLMSEYQNYIPFLPTIGG